MVQNTKRDWKPKGEAKEYLDQHRPPKSRFAMCWCGKTSFSSSAESTPAPASLERQSHADLGLSLYVQMMLPQLLPGVLWKDKRARIVLHSWGAFSCCFMDLYSQRKHPIQDFNKKPCMMCAVYSSRAGSLLLDSGQSYEDWIQEKNLQLSMLPTG